MEELRVLPRVLVKEIKIAEIIRDENMRIGGKMRELDENNINNDNNNLESFTSDDNSVKAE